MLKMVKGSSLVFSLIVLSFLLMAAISVATVSTTEKRATSSSDKSNVSFQVADSAAEAMLQQIYKVNDTGTTISTPGGLGSCNPSSNQISGSVGPGMTYVATLYSGVGTPPTFTPIVCGDPEWRAKVVKIKFQGTYRSTTRAIEVGVKLLGCDTPSVTDNDGNTYATVSIGTQCWMAENMMTTKYPDGTAITRGPTGATWSPSDNGYYAYPPNVTNTAEESLTNITAGKLGFVYQWSAAMHGSSPSDNQGICPDDWHVPTHDEYTTLERAVCTSSSCVTDFPLDITTTGGTGTDEGSKLSSETSGGTNSSGFTAHLAGYRFTGGMFLGRGEAVGFWSSLPSGANAWSRQLYSVETRVGRNPDSKILGFSVRCLKD